MYLGPEHPSPCANESAVSLLFGEVGEKVRCEEGGKGGSDGKIYISCDVTQQKGTPSNTPHVLTYGCTAARSGNRMAEVAQ